MSTPDSNSTAAGRKRQHRRVTPEVAQRWFDLHDRGETVAAIARNEKRDLRTVRDAINSVTADVEKSMVRREAMKEALKEHYRSLIAEVEALESRASSSRVPSIENLWTAGDGSKRIVPFEFRASIEGDPVVAEYEAENSVRWDMLTSHMKGALLLRRFSEWKRAVQRLVELMIDTKHVLVTGLENIGDAEIGSEAGRRLNDSGVRLIHEAIVNQAFGRQPNLEDVLDAIDLSGDAVRVSSHLLLAGVADPRALAARVSDFLQGSEVTKLVEALSEVAESIQNTGSALSREAQYVTAVPFPGGDCQACRRLGH